MISDEECHQVLNGGDQQYTKEQIELIKSALVHLARLEVEEFKKKKLYEEGSDYEQGLDR